MKNMPEKQKHGDIVMKDYTLEGRRLLEI